VSPNSVPVWSELARFVRKRLIKSEGRAKPIPHEHTIRKRLPLIYAQLLDETPAQK
jgi:hypothetical protein